MNSFTLSQKAIPDLRRFHNEIKKQVPPFDGILYDGITATILINGDITNDIISLVESIVPPQKVPGTVSARQIRQALILSGISLEQIDQAINALPEPQRSLARVEWEYSNVFERDRTLVIQIASVVGWGPTQLDSLWELANTL